MAKNTANRLTDAEWLAPVSPNPLTNLEQQIRAHWDEFRPKMAARMKASGRYEAAVQAAAELTYQAVDDAIADGMNLLTAWEAVRQWYAILPTEEDAPTLERGEPDTWVAPIIPEDEEE